MTNNTAAIGAERSVENFRGWLHHEIAKSSVVPFAEIDFSLSMTELGLSSIHIVRLTGELERLLDLELESSLIKEYQSVEEMCQSLLKMRSGRLERQGEGAKRMVQIAATFTAEPLKSSLDYLLTQLGLSVEVSFAGYNQVFQELLNPNGMFYQHRDGVNVVLFRIEDCYRFEKEPVALHRVRQDIKELITAFQGHNRLIVGLAPHSPKALRTLGLGEVLESLDQEILSAGEGSDVTVLDLRNVTETYPVPRIWDESRDEIGHIPFTNQSYAAMSMALARSIHHLWFSAPKVIVLDCDNTLWGGVTGEAGPEHVDVTGPFAALQTFMVSQANEGRLLCLASKNIEEDVWNTFEAHPEMPLTREHITTHRVNWKSKASNIAAMADELGLGLDAFVFVDDNPAEIAEVSQSLPAVMCVQLPEPSQFQRFLEHHWVFDGLASTSEDKKRTQLYKDNLQRNAMREETQGLEDFLKKLDIQVDITAVGEEEWERAAQLTNRTNQFNLNKVVRDAKELKTLRNQLARSMATVKVRDRFGDYGLVGLVSAVAKEDQFHCDIFLMSCRVLGRRVEHQMVNWLAEEASKHELETLHFDVVETSRNVPVRDFIVSLGGDLLQIDRIQQNLEAAVVEHELPPSLPQERSYSGLTSIAKIADSVDDLLTSVASSSRLHRPELNTPYVTPRSSWEKKIASIWREVLGIDRIGVNDSFYELGGDSLMAAETFARMWDLGIPQSISLQTMLEPTVAVLAKAIEDVKAGKTPDLLADSFSLEKEGMLAEHIRHDGYDVSTYDVVPQSIFLTGVTGYIGAFMLFELMEQTDVTITCLIRASSVKEGNARIVANLRRYGLLRAAHKGRYQAICGDLTEPFLGLGESGFKALAADIDTIVHSAAWVNFVYPYDHLKATNVDSTETILELAIAAKPKPIAVHFISTLGVIMSTGYAKDKFVKETDPLLYADDLLNGYEQTKYSSDKMVWTAFKERGIPGACYRPGMVSGLSDGTYHKLDEFLPQFLKGCIQLGSWPLVDTTWEIVPIDFVSKAIVHMMKNTDNLNQAYFTCHPEPTQVSDYIRWHRDFGYQLRGLPWDTWKQELLGLGTERLRKNGLFPFVDFIRALSEEQVFFPPTERTRFHAAIADMEYEMPSQLELLERYTKYFIECGYYENLPSGPRTLKPSERKVEVKTQQLLDESIRFTRDKVDFSEAYYVLWTDPKTNQSMVVRYVLHNGILEEYRMAEVWCLFYNRKDSTQQIAVRQRFPLGKAIIENTEEIRLRIGPCGYGDHRAWGQVHAVDGTIVSWDFQLDKSDGLAVNRVPFEHPLFPHFQSNGVKQYISGTVTVNDRSVLLDRQLASDGHYWNTRHLRGWAWAHCADFEGDPDFVFEGIGTRFNDKSQTSTWLTFLHEGKLIESDIVDAFQFNHELEAGLTSWSFMATRGDLRFIGEVSVAPEDMNLIIHALPDDEYLYTHISYCADMQIHLERKQGKSWHRFATKRAHKSASFEVTRKERNPEVTREFRIVKVK